MKKPTKTDPLGTSSEDLSLQAVTKKLRENLFLWFDQDPFFPLPGERIAKQAFIKLITTLESQGKNGAGDTDSNPDMKQGESYVHLLELAKELIKGLDCIDTIDETGEKRIFFSFLESFPKDDGLSLLNQFSAPRQFLQKLIQELQQGTTAAAASGSLAPAPAAALFHGSARERKQAARFTPKRSPQNYAALFVIPVPTLCGAPGGPPLQPPPPNSPEDRQSNQDDNNHPSGPPGAAPQPAAKGLGKGGH